ncbi:MAG: hypothetical protein KF904_19590 [Rhodoblastus sp.]|nr:hypothetical protein [Rhodoblastus sp.]
MPTVKTLLRKLDLGASVAEFDDALEEYFVETETFRQLAADRVDFVAGDKGTGKTAIYKILQKRYTQLKNLHNVEVVPAFNPMGSPIFSQLGERPTQSEGEYIKLWKSYFLALAGNWLLDVWSGSWTEDMKQLDLLLKGLRIRNESLEPKDIFTRIQTQIGKFFNWRSAEIEYTQSPDGKFTFRPKLEFGKEEESELDIDVSRAFDLLHKCFVAADLVIWIAMDRLDEAFQGYPEIEIPALRALFRTYLDLGGYPHVKIKLFVRRDLFRRITDGGFVNLTHINARKIDLLWDDEDLLNLLCRRIRKNTEFCSSANLENLPDNDLFYKVFPPQVDVGKRKPRTWVWIIRRIRDGNDIKAPRNLIDLISFAQQAQLRQEDREEREYADGGVIIAADPLRRALGQLSEQRVNDTLLAESRLLAPMIEAFRGGKAEHNESSLSEVLEVPAADVRQKIKPLLEAGFLEDIKGTYKIPALFRGGLEITLGKAFDGDVMEDEDESSD